MSKPRDDRQKDLLLPALDQIIDMGHPLVRLAALIDWNMLNDRFSSVCQAGSGQPGLPTRLVAGLFILKHMHNLSDEVLCARWIETNTSAARIELLPPSAVRSIVDDPLAPAARRGTARRADPGKSVGGAQDWCHWP